MLFLLSIILLAVGACRLLPGHVDVLGNNWTLWRLLLAFLPTNCTDVLEDFSYIGGVVSVRSRRLSLRRVLASVGAQCLLPNVCVQ